MEALMKKDLLRLVIYSAVYLIFSIIRINAEYLEGIDTTDSNGFGLDSSFWILPRAGLEVLSGNDLIRYTSNAVPTEGYLDCSFDDLKIVPDSIRKIDICATPYYSFTFIIKNKRDSTYSKGKVIKKLADGRYIYKYGTNTTPNNKLLISSGYNHSIKYKPNNLYNMILRESGIECDSFYWESPIQNNNQLLGYNLYASKAKWGVGIDTAHPIDITEWDSVAFYPSMATKAKLEIYKLNGSYINLIAVYTEGKSDFLDGWTLLNLVGPGVLRPEFIITSRQKKLSISTIPGGFFIAVPYLPSSEPFSISIFNPNGSLHSRISGIKGARAYLGNNFAGGLYLLRAEFPDRSVITQPFTITR
jgi:hypothetical protein